MQNLVNVINAIEFNPQAKGISGLVGYCDQQGLSKEIVQKLVAMDGATDAGRLAQQLELAERKKKGNEKVQVAKAKTAEEKIGK